MVSEHAGGTPSSRGPLRRLLRSFLSIDSYGAVLVLILITYFVSTLSTRPWQTSIVLLFQMAAVWVALRVSGAHRRVQIAAEVVLILAGVVAILNPFVGEGNGPTGLVAVVAAILYLIAPLSILRSLVRRGSVDLETVLGAIDAYLLIGMMFAFIYRALGAIQPSAFFGTTDGTISQDLFFSFTTLTTTGYGNLVPAGNPGQTFAVLQMLIGQLFLVTAVAKVISAWRPSRWSADGPADPGPGEGRADPPGDG